MLAVLEFRAFYGPEYGSESAKTFPNELKMLKIPLKMVEIRDRAQKSSRALPARARNAVHKVRLHRRSNRGISKIFDALVEKQKAVYSLSLRNRVTLSENSLSVIAAGQEHYEVKSD